MAGCRGSWMRSRFQTAIRIRAIIRLDDNLINYMRNSVKVVIDAYDGTTTFYVFDTDDPIIAAYRRIFPEPVQRCVHDAAGTAQTCALPRTAA